MVGAILTHIMFAGIYNTNSSRMVNHYNDKNMYYIKYIMFCQMSSINSWKEITLLKFVCVKYFVYNTLWGVLAYFVFTTHLFTTHFKVLLPTFSVLCSSARHVLWGLQCYVTVRSFSVDTRTAQFVFTGWWAHNARVCPVHLYWSARLRNVFFLSLLFPCLPSVYFDIWD